MAPPTPSARHHVELLKRIAAGRSERRKRRAIFLAVSLGSGVVAVSLLSWRYLSLQLGASSAVIGISIALYLGWRYYHTSKESLSQLALLLDETWGTSGECTALCDFEGKVASEFDEEKITIISSQLAEHLSEFPPTLPAENTFSSKQRIFLALGPLALGLAIAFVSIQPVPKESPSSIGEVLAEELEKFLEENPTLPKSIEKQLSELGSALQDDSRTTTELQQQVENVANKIRETQEAFSSLSEPTEQQPTPTPTAKDIQTPTPTPQATPTPEAPEEEQTDSSGEKNEEKNDSEGDSAQQKEESKSDSGENSEDGDGEKGDQGESGSKEGEDGTSQGESGEGQGESGDSQSKESSQNGKAPESSSGEEGSSPSEGEQGDSESPSQEQGSQSKEDGSSSASDSLAKAENLLQKMKEQLTEEQKSNEGKEGGDEQKEGQSPSNSSGEKSNSEAQKPSPGDSPAGNQSSEQAEESGSKSPRQAPGESKSDSETVQPDQNAEGQVSTQGEGPPVDREGGDSKFQEGGFGFEDKELGSSEEEFDTRYMEGTGRSLQNSDEVESQLKAVEQPLAPPQPKDSRKKQRIPLEYQNIITE